LSKQGVNLTRRNSTGPPCSVGRPTAKAAAPARRRPTAHAPDGRVTDNNRRQTPASKTILDH